MDKTNIKINCIYPVWITMTTIPERIDNTYMIIINMLSKLSGVDKIVLNLPYKYKRFDMLTFEQLRKLLSIRDKRFILNRCDDFGPATKLIPTLDIAPEESILVVCDDDCYHHEAFKIAAESQERNKSKTFTFWKYNYNGIEIPQGVDIITFWKPNTNGFLNYAKMALRNKYCFYVDDMIIGGFLSQNGIQIEQLDRKWKWPWIHNCFGKSGTTSLYGEKGNFNRDNSNMECYKHLK